MLNSVSGYGRKPVSFGSIKMSKLDKALAEKKEGEGVGIGPDKGIQAGRPYFVATGKGKLVNGEQELKGYYAHLPKGKTEKSALVPVHEAGGDLVCDNFSITGPVKLADIPLKRELSSK